MQKIIGSRLSDIYDNTSCVHTKNIINNAITIAKSSDLSQDQIIPIIENKLKSQRKNDKLVDDYFNCAENFNSAKNIGIAEAITELKALSIYEKNTEFRSMLDYHSLIKEHSNEPDNRYVDKFISDISNFSWNKSVKKISSILEEKVKDALPYVMLANAWDAMMPHQHEGSYELVFKRLNTAMTLPANMVGRYILQSLDEYQFIPEIASLLQSFVMMEKSWLSRRMPHTTSVITSAGRFKTTGLSAPTTKLSEHKVFMKNNRFFIRGKRSIQEVKDYNKLPKKYKKLCENISQPNIYMGDDMDVCATEDGHNICIKFGNMVTSNGDPDTIYFMIDGVKYDTIDSAMTQMVTIGISDELINSLLDIYAYAYADDNSIEVVDDTLQIEDGTTTTIVIVLGPNNISIMIMDEDGNDAEITNGMNALQATNFVQESCGFSIAGMLKEDLENLEVENKGINVDIDLKKKEMVDIEEMIKRIEELGDEAKADPELQKYYQELLVRRTKVRNEINSASTNIDNMGDPAMATPEGISDALYNAFEELRERIGILKTTDADATQINGTQIRLNDEFTATPVIVLDGMEHDLINQLLLKITPSSPGTQPAQNTSSGVVEKPEEGATDGQPVDKQPAAATPDVPVDDATIPKGKPQDALDADNSAITDAINSKFKEFGVSVIDGDELTLNCTCGSLNSPFDDSLKSSILSIVTRLISEDMDAVKPTDANSSDNVPNGKDDNIPPGDDKNDDSYGGSSKPPMNSDEAGEKFEGKLLKYDKDGLLLLAKAKDKAIADIISDALGGKSVIGEDGSKLKDAVAFLDEKGETELADFLGRCIDGKSGDDKDGEKERISKHAQQEKEKDKKIANTRTSAANEGKDYSKVNIPNDEYGILMASLVDVDTVDVDTISGIVSDYDLKTPVAAIVWHLCNNGWDIEGADSDGNIISDDIDEALLEKYNKYTDAQLIKEVAFLKRSMSGSGPDKLSIIMSKARAISKVTESKKKHDEAIAKNDKETHTIQSWKASLESRNHDIKYVTENNKVVARAGGRLVGVYAIKEDKTEDDGFIDGQLIADCGDIAAGTLVKVNAQEFLTSSKDGSITIENDGETTSVPKSSILINIVESINESRLPRLEKTIIKKLFEDRMSGDELIVDLREGLLGEIVGGLTGFALGNKIGEVVAKCLGVGQGILYDLLTSRLFGAAMGSSIGDNL